jgi:hypothetical protein
MGRQFDGTCSLFCITTQGSPDHPGEIPQLLAACVFIEVRPNCHEAYFLTKETLPIFWEQNPNLKWSVYDIGKTLAVLANVFDDMATVYKKVRHKKIVDVHLLCRLLRLAKEGDSAPFDSISQCFEFLCEEGGNTAASDSFDFSLPDFDERRNTPGQISPSLLHQLLKAAKLILQIRHQTEHGIDAFFDSIDTMSSFGLPNEATWQRRQQDAFGKLTHDIQAWADIVYDDISRTGLHVDVKRVWELSDLYERESDDLFQQMEYLSIFPLSCVLYWEAECDSLLNTFIHGRDDVFQ